MRCKVFVQFVEHNAGLNANPFFFLVEFQHLAKIFRHIHHDSVSHHLTGNRCSRSARNDAKTVFAGKADYGAYVVVVLRHAYRHRHFAVCRSVGSIDYPVYVVGADSTLESLF